jgi:beta-galactosidase
MSCPGERITSQSASTIRPIPHGGIRAAASTATAGPGEIVATDNGDPTSFESFQSTERQAFNGLCLVVVRAKRGQTGRITITARSEGLEHGRTILTVRGVSP